MILKPPKGALVNRGHPFARGLIGYWLMNEGGGTTVADLSGNNKTGVFDATAPPSWSTGMMGPETTYTGGDHIIINAPVFTSNTDVSVVAWFRPNFAQDDVSGDGYVVWSMGQAFQDNFATLYWRGGAVELWRFDLFDESSTGVNLEVPLFTFSAGDLLQIVCIKTTTLGIVYVNGVEALNQAHGLGTIDLSAGNSEGQIGLAISDFVPYAWEGSVDGMSIYSRALTAGEIAHLYREPFCMFEVDL